MKIVSIFAPVILITILTFMVIHFSGGFKDNSMKDNLIANRAILWGAIISYLQLVAIVIGFMLNIKITIDENERYRERNNWKAIERISVIMNALNDGRDAKCVACNIMFNRKYDFKNLIQETNADSYGGLTYKLSTEDINTHMTSIDSKEFMLSLSTHDRYLNASVTNLVANAEQTAWFRLTADRKVGLYPDYQDEIRKAILKAVEDLEQISIILKSVNLKPNEISSSLTRFLKRMVELKEHSKINIA